MSQVVTSSNNPRLKQLRKLHDRKQRDRSGLFLAEGEDMLREATRFGAQPDAVFYDPEALAQDDPLLAGLPSSVERVAVEGRLLAAAGSLGSGSRAIGVWPQRWHALPAGAGTRPEVTIYLHEVSDPGNVGAVLRSALGLSVSLVVVSPEGADPFGPKAVRASMGAVFGQPVARGSFEDARALGGGQQAIALVPRAGRPLGELDLAGPVLFALGSERSGLPAEIVAACDETAHVPVRACAVESLNVAVTASLCLYEKAIHRLSEAHG